MENKSFDEFCEKYIGMVCDFSEAEQKGFVDGLGKYAEEIEINQRQFWEGFESGLKAHFRVKEADFPIEQFCAFSTVHFARSAARVYRKHSVVPIQRKEEFKQKLSVLQGCRALVLRIRCNCSPL